MYNGVEMSVSFLPPPRPLGTPPRAGGEFGCAINPHGTLLLPEEEYPEGGRWWEKTPIGGGRKSFQINS